MSHIPLEICTGWRDRPIVHPSTTQTGDREMATLVNRECWYTFCILRHGIVKRQEFNPNICWVLFDGSNKEEACASSLLLLNIKDVLNACHDKEEYWKIERQRIEHEIEMIGC